MDGNGLAKTDAHNTRQQIKMGGFKEVKRNLEMFGLDWTHFLDCSIYRLED